MPVHSRRLHLCCLPSIVVACGLVSGCGGSAAPTGDAGNDASRTSDSPIDAPGDSTADAVDTSTPDATDASSPDGSHADAAGEAGDAGADVVVDGGGDVTTDAPVDGAGDAPTDALACQPVDRACADGGASGMHCVQSWSAARNPGVWCARFPYGRVFIATACDGFDIVVLGGVDTSMAFYYDPASGQLVGIEASGLGGVRCVAGESPDVPLTDCGDGPLAPAFCLADGSVAP
jgi:hypothetical protein